MAGPNKKDSASSSIICANSARYICDFLVLLKQHLLKYGGRSIARILETQMAREDLPLDPVHMVRSRQQGKR